MFTEAMLSISIATRQLCVIPIDTAIAVKCFPVAVGKPGFKTPASNYTVDKIYTNASLVNFTNGKNLGSDIIGGQLITLNGVTNQSGLTVAIHGWNKPITSGMLSHGCVRMNTSDIKQLINNYLFNEVIIE